MLQQIQTIVASESICKSMSWISCVTLFVNVTLCAYVKASLCLAHHIHTPIFRFLKIVPVSTITLD